MLTADLCLMSGLYFKHNMTHLILSSDLTEEWEMDSVLRMHAQLSHSVEM